MISRRNNILKTVFCFYSLSLLHAVRQYQFYARKKGVDFQLGAVTVDPLSSGYDPRPLIPYLAALGVEYLYEQQVRNCCFLL